LAPTTLTGAKGFDVGRNLSEASRGPRIHVKESGKVINAEPQLAIAA
jgi:hypothetical protein